MKKPAGEDKTESNLESSVFPYSERWSWGTKNRRSCRRSGESAEPYPKRGKRSCARNRQTGGRGAPTSAARRMMRTPSKEGSFSKAGTKYPITPADGDSRQNAWQLKNRGESLRALGSCGRCLGEWRRELNGRKGSRLTRQKKGKRAIPPSTSAAYGL